MPQKLTQEEFVLRSTKIHNNKFDYSQVEYMNNRKKVVIICPTHGAFDQMPFAHMQGLGCERCRTVTGPHWLRDDTEMFINKAMNIHGDKYDYSKVKYKNSRTKVTIICNKHGEFSILPHTHINGKAGCSKCNSSKGEEAVRKYLISNNITFKEQKWFSDCRDIRVLSFDFYLPTHNTLIEYDGIQHFKETSAWSHYNGLEDRKRKDAIKNQYAKDNNIRMLRIPYYKLKLVDKLIEDFL